MQISFHIIIKTVHQLLICKEIDYMFILYLRFFEHTVHNMKIQSFTIDKVIQYCEILLNRWLILILFKFLF